jgi:hypothetical protein
MFIHVLIHIFTTEKWQYLFQKQRWENSQTFSAECPISNLHIYSPLHALNGLANSIVGKHFSQISEISRTKIKNNGLSLS